MCSHRACRYCTAFRPGLSFWRALHRTKVPPGPARALQASGETDGYVRISGNGPDAGGFHIACTIGELSKSGPNAYFHSLSGDKGFAPLVTYLGTKGILAPRSRKVADVPDLKASKTATPDGKIQALGLEIVKNNHNFK